SFFFHFFFFFNDTATTEIYTLSLHDALPILVHQSLNNWNDAIADYTSALARSEEHTSELQSRPHLVCRLLLEKKQKKRNSRQRHSERGQLLDSRTSTQVE